MNAWAYAAACVLVPSAWALLVFFVFSLIDRRRAEKRREEGRDDLPPADYMI